MCRALSGPLTHRDELQPAESDRAHVAGLEASIAKAVAKGGWL